MQKLGLESQPDAYLYQIGQSSPRVAWMSVAKLLPTFFLTKEATKLSLDQPMIVLTPHQIKAVLELKGHI
jgi:hypothetical protein